MPDVELKFEVEGLLARFAGERSCKELFWSILSYEREADELSRRKLPNSIPESLNKLQVFGSSEAMRVVYAVSSQPLSGTQIEQLAWAAEREVGDCVLLLHDIPDPANATGWHLVYPSINTNRRVRILDLPGAAHVRIHTAAALAELAAEDSVGDQRDAQALYEELNRFFPGPTARLDQIRSAFAEIANHSDPEVRDLLPIYRLAGRYPLLTAEQERGEDLRGDEQPPDGSTIPFLRWRLIVQNLRLVLWQARKVPRLGMALEDLVQEGCDGLCQAAAKWQPERRIRFSTYALWWVKQRMYRAVHNLGSTIRWPVYRAMKLVPMALAQNETGLTPGEKVVRRLGERSWCHSLQTLPYCEEAVLTDEIFRCVHGALAGLDAREQLVISARFGLDGNEPQTLEQIGEHLHLTRERVRQIEAKALTELRGSHSFQLFPVLEMADYVQNGRQIIPLSRKHRKFFQYMRGQVQIYGERAAEPERPLKKVVTAAGLALSAKQVTAGQRKPKPAADVCEEEEIERTFVAWERQL